MRTFAKNYSSYPRTVPYLTDKQRRERVSTEWDIRIDVNDEVSPCSIRDALLLDLPGLEYALISGVEVPDGAVGTSRPPTTTEPGRAAWVTAGGRSEEDHVHIALIFQEPVNRERALRACREEKLTDEYAVPRNRRYTYAGWIAHHGKSSCKKFQDEPTIFFEHGELPEDPTDEATCWQVAKILKKFGTKEIKSRFKRYYEKLDEYKVAKLIKDEPNTPAIAVEYNI